MDICCPSGGRGRDHGFSLIELVIVVVLLGIIAAIAIPQFMSYAERGREAAVAQDLRSAALFMQVYRVDNDEYHEDGLIPFSPTSPGVTVTAPFTSEDAYCLLGQHAEGAQATRSYTNEGLRGPGTTCEGFSDAEDAEAEG